MSEQKGQNQGQGQGQNRNRYNGRNRNNHYRKGNFHRNNRPKVPVEETLEDIQADMARIEKEIELEIKEIASMRLSI